MVFASIKEQNPLKIFKNIVGWHTFKAFAAQEKGQGVQQSQEEADAAAQAQPKQTFDKIPAPEKNHEHALSIYAGSDNLLKIGEP